MEYLKCKNSLSGKHDFDDTGKNKGLACRHCRQSRRYLAADQAMFDWVWDARMQILDSDCNNTEKLESIYKALKSGELTIP